MLSLLEENQQMIAPLQIKLHSYESYELDPNEYVSNMLDLLRRRIQHEAETSVRVYQAMCKVENIRRAEQPNFLDDAVRVAYGF